MQLVSFDPFRTLDIQGVTYLKPEAMLEHIERLRAADWLLFPEYWQVNTLHYALGRRVFPSLPTYHLGHDKVEMTRAFQALVPAHVPRTLILPASEAAIEHALDTLDLPLVAKAPRSSMGEGVHLVTSARDLRAHAAAHAVLYLQEYLPIRRDLRVVVIGERAVCAYWREQPEGGFHTNVARGGRVSFEDVPAEAVLLAETVAQRLRIDHAGFDLAEAHGGWYLLEFNRLFGNQGLAARGIRPGRLIQDYLQRAVPPHPVEPVLSIAS